MTKLRIDTVRAVHERLDGEPWRTSRTSWLVPVMFTLDDGREVQSNHACRRAEVDAYVAALPRDVDVPLAVDDVERTIADMPLDHHAHQHRYGEPEWSAQRRSFIRPCVESDCAAFERRVADNEVDA